MSNLEQYKKLDEIEHVRQRSGMYLGSIVNTSFEGFLLDASKQKMEYKKYDFNPALVKMFDEIISNSVDEHRRSGKVSSIFVTVSNLTGEIIVEDDGGIPVEIHPEYKQYIPEMIFGELRTGSNFNDEERIGLGLNGLGCKLVSIFSTSFKVETADSKHSFSQIFQNGLRDRTKPVIKKSKHHGTKITFTPDYKLLNCSMSIDNLKRIEKRVYDVAGCNPKLKVVFNGGRIKINKFKDYVHLYLDDYVIDEQPDWTIGIGASSNGFQHVSFVNGGDTYNGGTHVDYVTNQIADELREYIRKKHKIDIKPSNIKQHLFVIINCTVNAPIFTSQTKEFMSSDVKDYGTQYKLDKKTIDKIIKSGVVQNILDWAEAQQRQKELAQLRKLNKATQNNNYLKKIVKFDDATSKDRSKCSLILTEGDSASKSILSARDPKTIGVFPLKGKPLNVRDIDIKRLVKNEEFSNIMSILGLKLGHEINVNDLRFSKLVLAVDADFDGRHIFGLIINMMQQFWPNLIKDGFIYRLNTPVAVAKTNKENIEFFSDNDYKEWLKKGIKHSKKYYKGLGSWSSKDFKKFLDDKKYLKQLEYVDDTDFDSIDLAFDKKRADDRKEWLK